MKDLNNFYELTDFISCNLVQFFFFINCKNVAVQSKVVTKYT